MLGLIIVVLAACELPSDAVAVRNESSQTITLVQEQGQTRIELSGLRPGEAYRTNEPCVADFVVLDSEGDGAGPVSRALLSG